MRAKATVSKQDLETLIQAASNDIAPLEPSRYTRKVCRAIHRVERAIQAMIIAKADHTLKRMRSTKP